MKRQSMIDTAHEVSGIAGDLFKWTLGSLLVVNGGAIVALLGSSDLRQTAFNEAGLLFGGGLLLALLGGILCTMAYSLFAGDQMRRAWDPTPVTFADFENLKTKPATVRWLVAGLLTWIGSFVLFAFACASMVIVPDLVAMKKARQESWEATQRYLAAGKVVEAILKDPNSTQEQRQSAVDRATTLQVEAEIALDREGKLLGEGKTVSGTR